MSYDFKNLSPADFEDLIRDLIGRENNARFEAFAAGPDGGSDGRHSSGAKNMILQAKHLAGSRFAALKSAMKRERGSIDRLAPERYILATSLPLSPANKCVLAATIGPWLHSEADIYAHGDLNALLRKYPDIEKAHIKLWLSSAAVLEHVFRSAAHTVNSITKAEIAAKVRVYAPNPSFKEARDTLEEHHVLIISGPPGVGKTTLAEMLSYAYIAQRWELVVVRSLDDGFASIEDKKKQVFFFDDFLGRVALDRRTLSHKDSDLARFIKRVRTSPNARFILTTRAYIFEEARRVSEHLADRRLDVSKYILDVGIYTRRIKARILYNHLLVSGAPQLFINSLVESGKIGEIIDHENYNPRIIEWMTDITHLEEIDPGGYPTAFLEAIAHPRQLWDIAFRTHISKSCQHLLFALFFGWEYGVTIESLRADYEALHPHLCAKYGEPHDPKDFEESLRILEGGFVEISDQMVSFVNPSLRDYLTDYLKDMLLLPECAKAAQESDWAQSVWRYAKGLKPRKPELRSLAEAFLKVATQFSRLPTWKRTRGDRGEIIRTPDGLSNTDRIELLVEWWEASEDQRFTDIALKLAHAPVDGLDSWRDGANAIELVGKLRKEFWFEGLTNAEQIADALEEHVIAMIAGAADSDELDTMSDAIEEWQDELSDRVPEAMQEAISDEIDHVARNISDIWSESTLSDHIETIKKLGRRAGIASDRLVKAVEVVKAKIAELAADTSDNEGPEVRISPTDEDRFDDEALRNLFAPLVKR